LEQSLQGEQSNKNKLNGNVQLHKLYRANKPAVQFHFVRSEHIFTTEITQTMFNMSY